MFDHKFSEFARYIANLAGRPSIFILAFVAVLLWVVTGPIFSYSDTWQLVINTGTTIVTFLMVFIIQNTQNRDNEAAQLKLDEIISSLKNADNKELDLEERTQEELDKVKQKYSKLAKRERKNSSSKKQSGKREKISKK